MSNNAAWWPPKVGDRLREKCGPDESWLLHVVAMFEHDDRVRVVTARWNIYRHQWEYEVRRFTEAQVGLIWPEGSPEPRR